MPRLWRGESHGRVTRAGHHCILHRLSKGTREGEDIGVLDSEAISDSRKRPGGLSEVETHGNICADDTRNDVGQRAKSRLNLRYCAGVFGDEFAVLGQPFRRE